ncbi:iron-containing alcohol dehydrogenase [candidate division KSB3 bacterium]|uniref:Iron-containing alcohol dehydrogenase n=1 Tax=candidate division KSB3 bacterium TaxID=2044937 RepID=A0A9D5Q4M3_9BACT|nr:iron-containing alcohol dehydrogenase [candidate division KSB3 bacterium]MBD3323864.1 iron-containing alcohol dehydrogenase [candidate division KSB3 bacterium]
MQNFVFQNPTKIIFGKATETTVGTEIQPYARKVLFHYGGGSIKKTGLYDRICESLKQAGIESIELPGAQPNPRLSLVRKGIEICRQEDLGFILAVGGGSVIDSAKAIAVGAEYDGDVWDFFEGKEVTKALPIGVVLTIPAAGSEASNGSVITNEDGWYKRPIVSEVNRPRFAILNPELTFTLTIEQTMIGIADMTAHLIERYFTQVSHVDLTDRLIEGTFRTLIRNAHFLLRDPDNYDARAEVMWAGTVAHNDWLTTGRVGDWGSHNIEHELSGIYDIPHGAGLSIIIPAWMTYVYKTNVQKFAQFAYRIFDVEPDFDASEETALQGIQRLKSFYKGLGLPVSLHDANIGDDRLEEMAAKCTEKGPTGNFVKLSKDDVLNIYKLAR